MGPIHQRKKDAVKTSKGKSPESEKIEEEKISHLSLESYDDSLPLDLSFKKSQYDQRQDIVTKMGNLQLGARPKEFTSADGAISSMPGCLMRGSLIAIPINPTQCFSMHFNSTLPTQLEQQIHHEPLSTTCQIQPLLPVSPDFHRPVVPFKQDFVTQMGQYSGATLGARPEEFASVQGALSSPSQENSSKGPTCSHVSKKHQEGSSIPSGFPIVSSRLPTVIINADNALESNTSASQEASPSNDVHCVPTKKQRRKKSPKSQKSTKTELVLQLPPNCHLDEKTILDLDKDDFNNFLETQDFSNDFEYTIRMEWRIKRRKEQNKLSARKSRKNKELKLERRKRLLATKEEELRELQTEDEQLRDILEKLKILHVAYKNGRVRPDQA